MRVFPFSAYVPPSERAGNLACTMQAPDLIQLAKHPDSYLRVVKPQFIDAELRPGTNEFLQASSHNFKQLITSQALIKREPAFWYYKQSNPDGRQFEGWVVGISAKDYEEGKIKKHENTIRDKEARLARHIAELQSVAEPVLLAGSMPPELRELAEIILGKNPDVHFRDPINRSHSLWEIREDDFLKRIEHNFGNIPALYIADGHHRSAATCLHIRNSRLDPLKNGVMALVMDKKDLNIKSFHRVIHVEAPVWNLEETCRIMGWEVMKLPEKGTNSDKNGIKAFSKEGSYLLHPGKSINQLDVAASLDVARLEQEIFPSLFGIENSRIDSRISFLRGDTQEDVLLQMLEDGKIGWIFAIPANSMDDVEQVADAGLVMPPKSTWVEPKLMTGMLIMRFTETGNG
jgi:uncharacterized protein (DUF1015 family)